MYRFLGKQTSSLINFVVQKILFASEMLRVRWKQEKSLRNWRVLVPKDLNKES